MKNTIEQFIKKSNEIHNYKYDYSLCEYINNITKMNIICPIHGIFKQNYKSHVTKKYGCPKCGGTGKKSTKEFIINAKKVHGNKFEYSLVNYKNNSTKVKIICPIHGVFEQKPNKHLNGNGCVLCSGLKKKTKQEFINDAKKVHGNKFNYSLVKYKNTMTKVKIICEKHGIFEQTPNSHLSGCGCPKCVYKKYKETDLYILLDINYNLYKIGKSINVNNRCKELNSRYYGNNKNNIKIIKKFKNKGTIEKDVHNFFKKYNLHHPLKESLVKSDGATEWFNFNVNECINYINNF